MLERDFKGVWIPKEIWLNDELTLLEKIILIEVDSLDNEEHCVAGNEYLAKFCQCSERKVSEAINKLSSLGFIEILSFDGRHRKLKSLMRDRTPSSMQSSKNCEAESQNLRPINIDNNIDKKNILNNKLFSTPEVEEKPKKKNLYNKCSDYIMQYTNNVILQDALHKFLDLRLEIAKEEHKPFYYNMWPNIVNDLDKLASSTEEAVKIVNQSTSCGWKRFYQLKDYSKKSSIKDLPTERNVDSEKKSIEELDLSGEVF